MLVRLSVVLSILLFASSLCAQDKAKPSSAPPPGKPRQLTLDTQAWTGDYDGMIERRLIRVLVPYSRTLYFIDKGRERGLTAELVRDFERYINQKHRKELGKRPITVLLVPTTRDRLVSGLTGGRGDIAAGNLTATEERRKQVDFFVAADMRPVDEVVVTGPKSPAINTADDLAGKTVHVRRTSSYYNSIEQLNARFRQEGKARVNMTIVPDALEDEDMLEMLNAGLLEAVIVDDWKAKMWAQILPKIKVNTGAVLRDDGHPGWAYRKGSPRLAAAIEDFYKNSVKKSGTIEQRLARYSKNIKQITNNTGSAEWKRFEQTLALFQKYGGKYQFDPMMLAAQGYQESQLRQDARSHVGAIGIMQVMPATGAELKVGDITIAESNVHAGAKYMDQLMTKFFPDAKFSDDNRALFAFASYNAGPGAIARMRREAVKRGLDQDKWFNNVELVVAEKIGMETTTYVRNIYKYYTAYKLQLEMGTAQRKAREQVAPGSTK